MGARVTTNRARTHTHTHDSQKKDDEARALTRYQSIGICLVFSCT